MWNDFWREAKASKFEGGPSQWWYSKHTSGYEVGEVDAGRYMATDPNGNGLVDETGDYVVFPNSDEAKRYVEAVISHSTRNAAIDAAAVIADRKAAELGEPAVGAAIAAAIRALIRGEPRKARTMQTARATPVPQTIDLDDMLVFIEDYGSVWEIYASDGWKSIEFRRAGGYRVRVRETIVYEGTDGSTAVRAYNDAS